MNETLMKVNAPKALSKTHFACSSQFTKPLMVIFICAGLWSCANTSHRDARPVNAEDRHNSNTSIKPQKSQNNEQQIVDHNADNYICQNPAQYAGRKVGDGHCVSLIKLCSGAPNTVDWRAGEYVFELSDKLKPGTIIATFRNGRYPSRTGFHSAIYIRHDHNGIWVWDQWRGKPVHQRLIKTRANQIKSNRAVASNIAEDYRVVKKRNR